MSAQATKSQSKKPAAKGKPRGLTAKQQRFVNEFLVDRNATRAAKACGYHPKMAAKLVAKGSIQVAIRKGEDEITQETKLSRDYVINGLMANAERAMQYREVLDKDGKPTGEFEYQGNVANKSYELLGKTLNMFTETRRIEFDEATLNAILSGLPAGLGEAVRAELSRIVSSKRG